MNKQSVVGSKEKMEIIDLRKYRTGLELTGWRRVASYPMLWMLSLMYGVGVSLWSALPHKAKVPPIPVLSVGSIAAGGTGKTPLTIYLAEKLASDSRVCVVSRGWRRKSRERFILVSDGIRIHCGPEECGDEPYMIAKRLPQVVVVVAKDRNLAISNALELTKPDVAILDDGFQYRKIVKAIEIISIDDRVIYGQSHFLPLGIMRESFKSIKADSIVIMLGFDKVGTEILEQLSRRFTIFRAELLSHLVDGEALNEIDPSSVGVRRILALSGIANPARFEDTCLRMGIRPVVSIRMDDHTWYDQRIVESIVEIMKMKRCEAIVTTEKDIHKLPSFLRNISFVVRMSIKIFEEDDLLDRINKVVKKHVS